MGKAARITSTTGSGAGVPPVERASRPRSSWDKPAAVKQTPPPQTSARPLLLFGICAILAASVAAVYWPVYRHQFVNFDDLGYIIQNPYARAGLTWDGLAWAFTSGYAANWHPLTWLSHMLDCQLFGLWAGGHHLTNLVLHSANTLLLFLFLRRMTGSVWRSAFVAALFGLHPVHVESVAWVAERKDVLSGLFFILTLWAYVKGQDSGARSQKPEAAQRERQREARHDIARSSPATHWSRRSPIFYLLSSIFFFALGLMSKPMLVTLPFVLLLLDYWPLGRLKMQPQLPVKGHASRITHHAPFTRLFVEKIPFFALSAASSIITYLVQQHSGAVADASNVPLEARVPNALLSYVAYLAKIFWPASLAVYYPQREEIPVATTIVCALLLLMISVVAIGSARRRPHLPVGWLWYLGTLVPVIGLVQVGLQAMADRYTYLPSIGIFIMVAWSIGAQSSSSARSSEQPHAELELCAPPRFILWPAAVAILAVCAFLSSAQVQVWKDSASLYRQALKVTKDNAIVHGNLGSALVEQGKFAEAADQFAEALRIKPRYAEAEGNLGFALALQGKLDEAIAHYRTALALKPGMERTHFTLGQALSMQGKRDEAMAEYRAALEINPDWPVAGNDLAWMLATDPDEHIRDGAKAVELAQRACRLTGDRETLFVGTLAAAYAEAGDFTKAVTTAEKARDLANARGQTELAKRNTELLELYKAGKPYREPIIKGTNP